MMTSLVEKYNVAVPRYTSYPTMPFWDNVAPDQATWKKLVTETFRSTNDRDGISIYIHLPFCESLCTYCGCNTRITVNHAVESPYIQAVLKEWSLYVALLETKPRIKEIHLGGGTPTFFSPSNLKTLLEGILEPAELCIGAELSFEAHPNNTTRFHLEALHQVGFERLSLGVQDFDPKVQDVINRIQTVEDVRRVTRQARELGYTSINYDLIYGLPFQTRESIVNTVKEVRELRPDRIAFYSYAHVPWMKPGQRKFTEDDLPSGEEKRALYELGRTLLEEAGYIEVGIDHFALSNDGLFEAMRNKKLHRNFMGYTTNTTKLLVGLGASSISDSWTGFVQNEKKVEDYYKRLESGEFPFFKGHQLSEEDLILRRHILQLMCNFYTSWKDAGEQTPALFKGIERLREMEKEGLVDLMEDGIAVTEAGKPFLRNICYALDARAEHQELAGPKFSKAI
ncbi:MAG: oxygen-independent coproporphyrinogen III oxidase [Bacteroidia bacterium]|nr:oxygen-independent coproporphyrinogen III oxidase [Bacteroidia bacterium]